MTFWLFEFLFGKWMPVFVLCLRVSEFFVHVVEVAQVACQPEKRWELTNIQLWLVVSPTHLKNLLVKLEI